MNKRICLVGEALSPPFDEGMKSFAFALARFLSERYEFLGLTNCGPGVPECNLQSIRFGKRLVSPELRDRVRRFSPTHIIYVPQASVTTNSFVRTWLLARAFPSQGVAVVGLQSRTHSAPARWLIRRMGPFHLFLQGQASSAYFSSLGQHVQLARSGVDTGRFKPVTAGRKLALRDKHGLSRESSLISHVGHLKGSRNLDWLTRVARLSNVQVLLVTSTSTRSDPRLYAGLTEAGVVVRDTFVERIEEVYQMSDCYLFPVKASTGAIDMPLSVLESLACGVPVVTTCFGALPEVFPGVNGVRFVASENELENAMRAMLSSPPDAAPLCALASEYSWEAMFEDFVRNLPARD